ncbi:Endo-1,3-1,4-beta-glycanase ExsH [compost metagenome]
MSKTAMNALGQPLYYSGDSTAWFSATGSGPTLHGTPGNDSLWGDSSVDLTMIGGAGEDIYFLY